VFAKPGALFKTTCGGSLSIEETLPISGNPTFTLFPNPANESVELRFQEAIAPSGAFIQLVDGAGKIVQTYTLQPGAKQAQLLLGDFAKGFYVLRLVNQRGKKLASKALLID
jgi:phage protein U